MIVELPDDLLRATGWAEGDLLEMEADPADCSVIRVTKRMLCDVCSVNTSGTGHGLLQAHWRNGDAERMRLCKSCFSYAMATLRSARRANHLFDDDAPAEK